MSRHIGLICPSPPELFWSLFGRTQHYGLAFSAQLSMCCACKGQNLHLEELVIKTQQEMTNLRIADGLCGQGERGWQVRTCCSGGCCALFPPLWLSSMIKEMILVIPAAVHILKLFGMLTSKPTPSCIFLTPCVFFRGESAAHIIYLKTFLCWSKWRLLWWRLCHTSRLGYYFVMETKHMVTFCYETSFLWEHLHLCQDG